MTIYCVGEEIEITDAVLAVVFEEKRPGEIKHHYAQPKYRKGAEVKPIPVWHIKALWKSDKKPLCDGKWRNAFDRIQADGAINEIYNKLHELNPFAKGAFDHWNKTGETDRLVILEKNEVA